MQVPRKFILAIAFLLQFLPAAAGAAETAEASFFDETPIILTASRMSKPLEESPASVSVITRKMIERSGMREVADLFRLVPGFVVGFHNGNSPTVSYHGFGREFAHKIQVLIDGRSVFIPSFGGVPWTNLPLMIEDIERIEIIRGPNAVTYGANAFLATINIITRDAAEDIGAQLTVTKGDNANPDIDDAYFRIAQQNNYFDWRLSLGTLHDDGFSDVNDSKRTAIANLRLDFTPASNQFWSIHSGISTTTAGRGFEDSPSDIIRDEEVENGYFNIHWEGIWESSTSSVRLTHTRQEVVDNFDPGPFTLETNAFDIPGVTTYIDFDRISDRTDLELVQSHELDPSVRLVYGAGLRKDKVKSLFLLNETSFQEVESSRLFSGVEWRLSETWLIDLGVMLEDSDLTSRQDSKRVSLIKRLNADHSLRFVVSEAKRNPILWEYQGKTVFPANATIPPFGNFDFEVQTWQGNNQIVPEEIRSYEIGLRSKFRSLSLQSDIKLFSYKISNHLIGSTIPISQTLPIVGATLVDTATTINEGESRIKGLELSLDYQFMHTDVRSGFSFPQIESSTIDFENSVADYTAFITLYHRIDDHHEISAGYYYADEISWLDTSRVTPASRRLDMRYAYSFNNSYKLELIGQNLLEDVEDYDPENIRDQVVYLRFSAGF